MLMIKPIDARMLDDFVIQHPYGHYMKTSMWANIQKDNGYDHVFLGFYDQNKLVATAMVLTKKSLFANYHYVPLGPCVDYEDVTLTGSTIDALVDYSKKAKVDFLRIDPNVTRIQRDIKGNAIEGGINHENITALLISHGFNHKGYGYAYNGSWTNRYTLIINLDQPLNDVVNHFSKQRLNSLRRHDVIGVTTRLGNKNDLDSLCEFEKQLAAIQGFHPHSKGFFENLLDTFRDNAVLYVTSIDLNQMVDGITREIESGKYHKDKEALASKQNELQKAKTLMGQYGSNPDIAVGLFIRLGHQSWDLYTYNHKAFNFVKAVDNLHRFAIEDMQNHGVKDYDMCGFSGVVDRKDPYFGLYDYKKSFGSEFIERIGEFDWNFHPKKKELWFKWDYNLRRVKRKLNRMRFGKSQ